MCLWPEQHFSWNYWGFSRERVNRERVGGNGRGRRGIKNRIAKQEKWLPQLPKAFSNIVEEQYQNSGVLKWLYDWERAMEEIFIFKKQNKVTHIDCVWNCGKIGKIEYIKEWV